MPVTADIVNISRSSLHDGPGVRTVVYFKGCGLRCKWCHNPETIDMRGEIIHTPVKCIGCGKCVEICPDGHVLKDGKMQLNRAFCTVCGRCAAICPTGALSVTVAPKTVDDLMKELQKDRHYYAQSGGGVTLSGGECLLQAAFCAELLKACKDAGIHTLIETALFVPWEHVEMVLPHVDAVFADFKIADSAKHKAYTGQPNERILENLARLVRRKPNGVTVRIPLIPGVNDSPTDVDGFAGALFPFADALKGIEILRYNALAKSKYEFCGKEYTDFGQPQSDEALLAFCNTLQTRLDNKVNVYTVI